MVFDKLKKKLLKFLNNSNVNLGRKKSKTREAFLKEIIEIINIFESEYLKKSEQPKSDNPMNNSVLCIKPKNKQKGLDIGKGVHAMTPTESMRADEQLGRSPYSNKSPKGNKNNE